jgi:precorrin-3B methylase
MCELLLVNQSFILQTYITRLMISLSDKLNYYAIILEPLFSAAIMELPILMYIIQSSDSLQHST